jgi:hypothetical protein
VLWVLWLTYGAAEAAIGIVRDHGSRPEVGVDRARRKK